MKGASTDSSVAAVRAGGINRSIMKLAFPSILANMTVPLVGLVDTAIMGHIGSAAAIGGIAIGSMLFDLLYWNFGFLRVGTSGMTAQAYGRRDLKAAVDIFSQGIATALGFALIIWAVQTLFIWAAFSLIECTPEVEKFAKTYFFIRIWAAPATLSLMAFKGWFIGMQNTVLPMVDDIVVNVVNIVASYLLAVNAGTGMAGVAWGTVIAQYTGLILAIILMCVKFRDLFPLFDLRRCIKWKLLKGFYKVNGNLFIRSICFMFIYVGFTSLAARFGDVMLAVSNIMMKLLMIFSYFIDGFAYAGEALAGKLIGERDRPGLRVCVRLLFIWGVAIGVLFTLAYVFGGEPMFRLMTSDPAVVSASVTFIPWLAIMPLMGCAAFMWDGIYVGATETVPLRNCMIAAAASFFIAYFISEPLVGVQSIYIAYFTHLLVRTVGMSLTAKKHIYEKPFS